MIKKIAVIGAGSWGTALAMALTRSRAKHAVALWVYETDICESLRTRRVNEVFLPGFEVPREVAATNDFAEALDGAEIVLGVMPSGHARGLYSKMLPHLKPEMVFVSATKGLDPATLERITQVIEHVAGQKFAPRVAALSGPSFAKDDHAFE